MDGDALVMYVNLSEFLETCKMCCVYHENGENLNFALSTKWAIGKRTVEICKDSNDENKQIHLRSKEGEYNVNDVKLEPLQAGFTHKGLLYGEWFWAIPPENEGYVNYLICNMNNGLEFTDWWDQISQC